MLGRIKVFCLFYILLAAALAFSHEVTNKLYESLETYPVTTPYDCGYLQVSDIHTIYYAQFGNPDGLPVIVVHGGPGAGCSDFWSSFFDPSFYRVIMFDQRAAQRSTPFAEMFDNTPQASVRDMEALRVCLKIDKWLIFGGSWGSTLSIFYGETHPKRCLGFILRGIFLGRQHEYEHLFYGMKATFPEAWEEMVLEIPIEEREDLIAAFHTRVMDPDPAVHLPAAHAFMRFDTICGALLPDPELLRDLDDRSALSTARAFIHYCANHFFFSQNQLLDNIGRISHLPLIIVQGRYDIICPPRSAYELFKSWKNSNLWFICNAGHFSSEPSISRGLRLALDEMKQLLNNKKD